MLANVCTGAIKGIEGFAVSVEVDIAAGMPTLAVVGLPDAEVRESKERVVAAVRNSGFDFPSKRITVNLSPAELRKSGTQFDLPIALGILAASGQLSAEACAKISHFLVLGELALDGSLRPCAGVLPMLISCQKLGKTAVIAPQNVLEGQVSGAPFITPHSLRELADYLEGKLEEPAVKMAYVPQSQEEISPEHNFQRLFREVLYLYLFRIYLCLCRHQHRNDGSHGKQKKFFHLIHVFIFPRQIYKINSYFCKITGNCLQMVSFTR